MENYSESLRIAIYLAWNIFSSFLPKTLIECRNFVRIVKKIGSELLTRFFFYEYFPMCNSNSEIKFEDHIIFERIFI